MAKLFRTLDAAEDLAAIWQYVSKDNEQAADRLVARIDNNLESILRNPYMGESVDHIRPNVRRFVVGNYQLFYEVVQNGVNLLRVYHAARRVEDLFD